MRFNASTLRVKRIKCEKNILSLFTVFAFEESCIGFICENAISTNCRNQ